MIIEAAYAVAVVNSGRKLTSEWHEDLDSLWPVIPQLAAL